MPLPCGRVEMDLHAFASPKVCLQSTRLVQLSAQCSTRFPPHSTHRALRSVRALHDSAVLSSRNVDVNNCGKANFAGCPRDGWNGAMFPTMSIPAVPLYKFVLGFQQARACRSCTSPAGVAVLLNERHANRNVAHAMKDASSSWRTSSDIALLRFAASSSRTRSLATRFARTARGFSAHC